MDLEEHTGWTAGIQRYAGPTGGTGPALPPSGAPLSWKCPRRLWPDVFREPRNSGRPAGAASCALEARVAPDVAERPPVGAVEG